ncbi:centromere-associated protein E-like [Heptranchias perlo]|uniref:centromere-associated protein E-like n=1 Tax=Heptranchias perlo TaxID=212740 RepID=UPI003559EC6C
MPNREFLVRVSYMEIYNESVSDLLTGPKRRPLEVREDMERIYVADLTEELAVTYKDAMKWLRKGEKNRHYGETKMNKHSSRSHTIFRVVVENREKNNEAVMVAHLNLVDLAGSERASQTGAEGVRLKEGCNINRSLFVLAQVIKKLSDGQAGGFVNYRDSKLTRILQSSLGGNARTLIICTITPVGFEETLSTLQFASTAKFMKNTPHVNEVLEDQAMLKRCRKEIMDLKNHLEELALETRVHAIEKAQLLSDKGLLQLEYEQKIKNLTRMLVRVSTDEDQQEMRARRKRRVTWAPGKLRASLDSASDGAAKIIKLDKAFQELDEADDDDDDFDVDVNWRSETISECSSAITVRRGGSCGFQIPSFEDSLYFNDQGRSSQNSPNSELDDVSSKDELQKRISELEKQLETVMKEKQKDSMEQKNHANHFEKQLKESVELCELLYSEKFDAESLKMENEKQKEDIEKLKELLKERLKNSKYLKMENEKQKNEIKELEKQREGIEDLKERHEIEEFEFLEKETEKEEKAQQKHENAKLRELVHNSEIFNQELEAELKNKTKKLKEQEQQLLDLQQQLEQLKEVMDSKVKLETLMVQIKQLQQSLNDAEVVTCDAKKESAFLRSENLELKEETNEMRVRYQQMEKDIKLYCSQLDAERTRYKQMQADLQKELQSAFNENTKLMLFLDGKVPKDLLDRVNLEKNIADLKQWLDKAEKEKTSLQQEADRLSQYKLLPEKVDELAKQVLELTEELNGVASERDNLLVGREENVEQLKNLRGEMSAMVQDRNKFQEVLDSLRSERDLQENLKTGQQNEMQCRVENLEKELDLYSTQLAEEKAKCAQLQHDIEDKERQVKEQEQQLMQDLEKQKEMDDQYSKASENLKLLNEMKEEMVIKLQVLTKANEELTMSQSKSHQKEVECEVGYAICDQEEGPLNMSIVAETTNQELETEDLTEQRLLLQKNFESLSSEKEELQQELTSLRTEREQLKCDLQDNIEMCIENQAELRNLQEKLKLNQCAGMELEKRLTEKEHLVNEEKEKAQGLTEELHNVVSQCDLLKSEIKELRAHVSKEQNTKVLEEEFNQRLQQLEDEKSSIVKEKDDLQEILESIILQRDEMQSTLQENTELMQEQTEELHRVVSQRDVLLGEIEELRAHVSKEQDTDIPLEKFNQQLEDEKSTIVKGKKELQEILESVKTRKDNEKGTLQENTEMIQEGTEELHCVVSQHDVLFSEIKELKAPASKEQSMEIQEEKFNQRLRQLEDEKLSMEKEEILESIKAQRDEVKSNQQENTEMERAEELHRVVSQRDILLSEVENLRACVSKEQNTEIQEEEFNQRLQQLEDEKSSIVKEKDDLQEILENVKVQRDEMQSTLQENAEMMQERTEELHRVVSQRDVLLGEIEELRAHVFKEQSTDILQEKFNQHLQQLEDEKSTLVKEKEELQKTLDRFKAQWDDMKSTLQENTEVSVQAKGELQKTHEQLRQKELMVNQLKIEIQDKNDLVSSLQGRRSPRQDGKTLELAEEFLHMESEHHLLRAHVSKEQSTGILEEDFNQRLQQLEGEKSSIVKEKDDLQEILDSIKVQRDEMKSSLQEKAEMMQERTEELYRVVSQRDVLLGEIEELRTHILKEQSTEILEEKFNQQLQQLEDEKSTIVQEKEELQEILESVKVQRDEMKSTLQENTEMMQERTEEFHHVVSQRNVLLNEIDELRAHASKEQNTEILEEKFNQQLQQLEDEKSTIVKEKEELQEILESVKVQRDKTKSTLQENIEMMQERTEELHRVVSQRDVLLGEIEELRAHILKEQSTEILEEKFNLRLQQLEDEKSTIVKEKEELQEILESVKVQRDEMKSTLQENTEMMQERSEELHRVVSQRNVLLSEIDELRAHASKEQNTEILDEKFNQQLQQLEDEKSTIVKEEMLESIKVQRDKMKSTLQENTERLIMEEQRNKKLTELVAALEKQTVTLKEEQTRIESTNSETDAIEAEINKLSSHLQEKDLLLQNAIQSLFQLESEYKIKLAKVGQELSKEGEAWKELLVRLSSEMPEESAQSKSIGKLQEENEKLYEKLLLWRSHFMGVMSTVPYCAKNYQIPITKCDTGLAEEKKKNEELLIQLQTLKKQVSDSAELELTSEGKNSEIRRLSTLIENKENHLQNTHQTLSELKPKYQNFLTSAQNGLHSKTKSRKDLMERISDKSCADVLKAIEDIKHENQTLNQEAELQQKTLLNEAKFYESIRIGYEKYIRNSCDELANEKKKNEELLLQIEALRQRSFNENGCDPLLAVENQKLNRKLKTDEQLLQKMRIKIHELEMALAASQETYKQQDDKVTALQTELRSKTLENKLDLQTKLLKDSQIKNLEETLEQLKAKVDLGSRPFKEETTELKNRLFVLEMEKVKESKHLENQICSLKASLEHKEELLRQMKEKLRRNQQEQDTTIMVEHKDETRSADASLSCSAGSGIVQNALLLVLNSEKAKLNRDLNQLKKENARLTRTVTELKYENNKLKEKVRVPSAHRLEYENVQHTLTLSPQESLTSLSQREHAPVPQKVEISTELFPPECKTAVTQDSTSLASGKMLPVDSSKLSSFGMESHLWPLPRTKIFDNSQLGFLADGSPQQKPKPDENEHDDWWRNPSTDERQCKMQ